MHDQHLKWNRFYCMINNYHPAHSLICRTVTVALNSPPVLSLRSDTVNSLIVHTEYVRPVCVCVFPPWKQKALQWQRELQCSATIHPELQTVWVPTHSCSSHTLLLLQITRGRERGGKARDQAGPGRDAGNLNEASHPFDSLSEAGRECVDCK